MIGSDTAGGLFGPVVFIGAAAGGACGAFFEAIFPGPEVELYLASLVALDPDSWSDLPPLMRGQT